MVFKPILNAAVAAAKPSATYRMMQLAAERKASGAPVISLTAGEPDFCTPTPIREAASAAIARGETRYTPVAGLKALREAVARKFTVENGIETDWRDTLVGSGAKHVIYNALAATLNTGDEVVVPAPYWVSYPEMVQICGGVPIIVSSDASSGYKLDAEQLDRAITARTRWLLLNSPSNPSGAVYSAAELERLAEVLRRHPQVMVLSDDIYEHLVFDGLPFSTMAQVAPDLRERILTVNGVSKAYAMTGWRIGYATGPGWLLQAMETLQGQQTSGASSISQHAALSALTGPQDFIGGFKAAFQRRRDLLLNGLTGTPGLALSRPDGAFYVFVSCEGLIGCRSPNGKLLGDDEQIALALLEEADVGVVHGTPFGVPGHLRIAYAVADTTLLTACTAIRNFAQKVS